jgi:hypothetical protein
MRIGNIQVYFFQNSKNTSKMSAMEMEITPQKSSKKQDSRVQQDESNQDNTPMVEGKRKRRKNDEEAELARRRRRRQSLAFQQRRKSLTPSKNKSGDTPTKQKRQYISDMYATVIKMSSENVRSIDYTLITVANPHWIMTL